MEWWQIYLLTRLGPVGHLFTATAVTSSLVALLAFLSFTFEPAAEKITTRILKIFVPVSLISAFVAVLIPTDEDIAVILAGHWATHNKEMQKLPDNVLKTLNGVLEKAQEKLK